MNAETSEDEREIMQDRDHVAACHLNVVADIRSNSLPRRNHAYQAGPQKGGSSIPRCGAGSWLNCASPPYQRFVPAEYPSHGFTIRLEKTLKGYRCGLDTHQLLEIADVETIDSLASRFLRTTELESMVDSCPYPHGLPQAAAL